MNNLRELRNASKLSLRGLGKEVDMNASVLGNYERGERQPKQEVWQKLADYFDVDVAYIMGLSNYKNKDKSIKTELKTISEYELNELLKYKKAYYELKKLFLELERKNSNE